MTSASTHRKRLPPYGKKLLLQLQRNQRSNLTIRVALGLDAIGMVGELYRARNDAYPDITPCIYWLAWTGDADARATDWSILRGHGVLGLMQSAYDLPDWKKAALLVLWSDAGASGVAITDKRGHIWTLSDLPMLLESATHG